MDGERKSMLTMASYTCERKDGWRPQTVWTNNHPKMVASSLTKLHVKKHETLRRLKIGISIKCKIILKQTLLLLSTDPYLLPHNNGR